MKVLLDTNVVLDVLLARKPFLDDSFSAMEKALEKGHLLFLSATAATDVYYLCRKAMERKEDALDALDRVTQIVRIAPVNEDCILEAMRSDFSDFEDAVVEQIATLLQADCILSRNAPDFKKSSHRVLTPTEFIAEL